jgi:hypothetical protein
MRSWRSWRFIFFLLQFRKMAETINKAKLSAWRDDVDIANARRLLQEMSGSRDEIWQAVEPHLVPGDELKAQYAFADLWETLYGGN